jgi:hypothetical protein
MSNRSFPAIDLLMRQVEQSTFDGPDPLRMLATAIKLLARKGVDPYLLTGILIEGAVHSVANHIPPTRQADTAAALMRLLVDRLRVHGLPPTAPED